MDTIREVIRLIEEKGDIAHVRKPVSGEEVAALIWELNERKEEGPFSEFQDCYVAGTGMNPVIRTDRLMMRKDAIYKEIRMGLKWKGAHVCGHVRAAAHRRRIHRPGRQRPVRAHTTDRAGDGEAGAQTLS